MSLSAIAHTAVGSGLSDASRNTLASDYQSFLNLLVAQVSNQDPLEPMESSQFVSQLAQLTQVEQSVQVNTQMEALRRQLSLNAALSETALIGREVTVPSETFSLDEDGARFAYELGTAAETVQLQIRDASGALVAVIDQPAGEAGARREVSWDGMTSGGLRAENGRYGISVAAITASGEAGSYQTYSAGKVVAIDYNGGSTWLQLADGTRVSSGDIIGAR
ncbi:flagellar hook assembly protein FlgD [Falsigemmobacter intermedius]|uniref:flagellar hook assembly protein FlgD n=1 Tax=Falsigemmobacter intermedius TaxID=1553448 RepID=UPI003F0D91C6